MARKLYIIPADSEVNDKILAAAESNGCSEIVKGIPPSLAGENIGELPAVYEEPEPAAPVQSRDIAKELDGLKADVANIMKVFI
jgi:hypothetical protein